MVATFPASLTNCCLSQDGHAVPVNVSTEVYQEAGGTDGGEDDVQLLSDGELEAALELDLTMQPLVIRRSLRTVRSGQVRSALQHMRTTSWETSTDGDQ